MASDFEVAALFVAKARDYLLVEYWTKLRCAVDALPAEALWRRPHAQSNSAGNLLLHLEGNIRQWIVDGIQRAPSGRNSSA
jgi:hypothetical protein